MPKIVTFGEIMLRLSPPGFERFFQSPVLSATFGGGEANVAVSLSHFGLDSHYVTRLPKHAIGESAIRSLRAEGVNVGAIDRGGAGRQRRGVREGSNRSGQGRGRAGERRPQLPQEAVDREAGAGRDASAD